jgi:hypothetical protein
MRNFRFLFEAWMAVWVVFLVFEFSVSRRLVHLREEINQLKQQLRDR